MTSPARTRVPGQAGPGRAASRTVRLNPTAAMDAATHMAVLALAAWTLVYDAGLAAHLGTSLLLVLWALCLAAILAAALRFHWPDKPSPDGEGTAQDTGSPSPAQRALGVAGLVLGIGAGVAAGLHPSGVPWVLTWALGAMSVAATLMWLLRAGHGRTPAPAQRPVSPGGSLLAAGTAAVAAGFSLDLSRPNGDDAYYGAPAA